MLVSETVARIRREHVDGKSIKAIARDLRLSGKVVRKAIHTPADCFAYQRTVQPLPRLGPFQKRWEALLVENEVRPRCERLRMTRIRDLLRLDGFDGSYDAACRYCGAGLRERRKGAGDSAAAFIPLMLPHLRCIAFGSGREKPAS